MKIEQKEYPNGYKYIEIQNNQAHAKISLQGGHIFHYQRHHESPLLWLSDKALFQKGKAIRGGVPICFPWFGKNKNDASLAQHGFARTELWKLIFTKELNNERTHIRLELTENQTTLAQWNHHFKLHLDIIIGEELTLELTTYNTDKESFGITTALHSYFMVLDVDNVLIEGLDTCKYLDSLDGKNYQQNGDVKIKEEIDRIYFNPYKRIILNDKNRIIRLEHSNSNSLVVWNPWIEKSQGMVDMSDEGYRTMLCLETANVDEDFKIIKPNHSHTLKVVISQ